MERSVLMSKLSPLDNLRHWQQRAMPHLNWPLGEVKTLRHTLLKTLQDDVNRLRNYYNNGILKHSKFLTTEAGSGIAVEEVLSQVERTLSEELSAPIEREIAALGDQSLPDVTVTLPPNTSPSYQQAYQVFSNLVGKLTFNRNAPDVRLGSETLFMSLRIV
jgi:hypothetical protein